MVMGLRFVCLCLTTNTLRAYPRGLIGLKKRLANGSQHFRMSSDHNVGQSDIGSSDDAGETLPDGGSSWRALLQKSNQRSRKIRGSNFVQLATVDPASNEPRCRSIVFRGFLDLPNGHMYSNMCDDMTCLMRMCTHLRSGKVEQSRAAELVWWFAKSSEQYRVQGDLVLVGGGTFESDSDEALAKDRKNMWNQMSDSARESFLSSQVPGENFAEESATIPPGGKNEDGEILPPPDNFLLMLLVPKKVDYLRLTNMYRQIDERSNGIWSSQRVNP
jgi:pyridoxamine 5'-phosphate oxidase